MENVVGTNVIPNNYSEILKYSLLESDFRISGYQKCFSNNIYAMTVFSYPGVKVIVGINC